MRNFQTTRMHSSRMRTARSSSRRGVCLSACWDTPPWVWAWRPSPQVWAWKPPRPDPSTSPLGVGLETLLGQTPQLPPGCGPGNLQGILGYHLPPRELLQGMLGYHLQYMLGYHPPPPMNRITDTCNNITLPQLRCGR